MEKPSEEPQTFPYPKEQDIAQSEAEERDTPPAQQAERQQQPPEVQRATQLHPTAASDRPRRWNAGVNWKYHDFVMCVCKLKSEASTFSEIAWKNTLSGGEGVAKNDILNTERQVVSERRDAALAE